MHVLDEVRLIIYRYHEKGLEIFLVNTGFEEEKWKLPFEQIAKYTDQEHQQAAIISLGKSEDENGKSYETLAVEGDWHDIPSLRKLVKGDLDLVASKVKYVVDKGAFFAFKEVFKKVLPHEYQVLDELKDILTARNMLSNI